MVIFVIVLVVILYLLYREWRRIESGVCNRDDNCPEGLNCSILGSTVGECVTCERNSHCPDGQLCTSNQQCIDGL